MTFERTCTNLWSQIYYSEMEKMRGAYVSQQLITEMFEVQHLIRFWKRKVAAINKRRKSDWQTVLQDKVHLQNKFWLWVIPVKLNLTLDFIFK